MSSSHLSAFAFCLTNVLFGGLLLRVTRTH
jgi:hypothetical protein